MENFKNKQEDFTSSEQLSASLTQEEDEKDGDGAIQGGRRRSNEKAIKPASMKWSTFLPQTEKNKSRRIDSLIQKITKNRLEKEDTWLYLPNFLHDDEQYILSMD